MSRLFYDHLIVIDDVYDTLITLNLKEDERSQTLEIIDETIHHHVLDIILTHLPKEHHKSFLERLTKTPHDKKILSFIDQHSKVSIKEKIQEKVDEVKKELLELILQK